VLNFTTKIYHPNVSNDDKGSMCLGLLRPDTWKPSSKLGEVLRFAYAVIETPDPDDAVEQSIAREYKDEKANFEKQAKEWTKKYAKA
jgi:ubiquitin-protein ligase